MLLFSLAIAYSEAAIGSELQRQSINRHKEYVLASGYQKSGSEASTLADLLGAEVMSTQRSARASVDDQVQQKRGDDDPKKDEEKPKEDGAEEKKDEDKEGEKDGDKDGDKDGKGEGKELSEEEKKKAEESAVLKGAGMDEKDVQKFQDTSTLVDATKKVKELEKEIDTKKKEEATARESLGLPPDAASQPLLFAVVFVAVLRT